ncbi:MAG TPA: DMT family transporter, partial [Quisquiliibacterium sp.]|nr:DMT family transporter [Quisquiliibacterium sp.]
MLEGVACALAAGLLWGAVFVAPVMLPEYPPAWLSVGRYLAFGLIALPLALASRPALAALDRSHWAEALRLSLVGNLLYYGLLAAAIQAAEPPLPTMIIGTLPVVIAISANLGTRELPWSSLGVSLAVIAGGLALVNADELTRLAAQGASPARLWLGALLACGALACWTWYPIRNARWLRRHPGLSPVAWSTAQGLATLPLALAGGLALLAWETGGPGSWGGQGASPFGPRPFAYAGWMLALGLCASWLGTLLWNRASQRLPTSLAGQLIVFETLAALAYAFAWRGQLPPTATLAGIGLLMAGVMLGVRA